MPMYTVIIMDEYKDELKPLTMRAMARTFVAERFYDINAGYFCRNRVALYLESPDLVAGQDIKFATIEELEPVGRCFGCHGVLYEPEVARDSIFCPKCGHREYDYKPLDSEPEDGVEPPLNDWENLEPQYDDFGNKRY